jgi:uncharacterized membrane protein YccF (DUF307 family)
MGALRVLGNILWHVPFLGFLQASMTFIAGCIFMATVIGAPIGLGLMEYSKFLFWPFGKAMVSKNDLNIKQNDTWKKFSFVVMVLYFPFGLILCALAIVQVGLMGITIIGIPSALVIAKSLGTFLNPVFKKCVHVSVAEELEKRKGQKEVETYLGTEPAKSTSPDYQNTSESVESTPTPETQPVVILDSITAETIIESHSNTEATIKVDNLPTTEQQPSHFSTESSVSSGPNKFAIGFVAVIILIAAGFGFSKYQSNSKFKVSQTEASTFLGKWCSLQSNKTFSQYVELYSQDFQGIKRTKSGKIYNFDYEQWMSDRAKLYKRARYLSVAADNIAVMDFDSNSKLTTVQFTQRYSSDKYSDQGTKLVKLRKSGDGNIKIAFEEMLNSN